MDLCRISLYAVILTLFAFIDSTVQSTTHDSDVPAQLRYTSDQLKAINSKSKHTINFQLPSDIRKRNRGMKGGVKAFSSHRHDG